MSEQRIDSDGRYVMPPEIGTIAFYVPNVTLLGGVASDTYGESYRAPIYFERGNLFVNERSAQRELDLRILIQDIRRYCAENGIEIIPNDKNSDGIFIGSAVISFEDDPNDAINYNNHIYKHFKQRIDAANAPFDWMGE